MKKSDYHWIKTPVEENSEVIAWLKENNLSLELAPLLSKRNIKTQEQLMTFFEPNLENLYDPYLLYGMDKAVARINQAIELGEKIVIYGDYDADGITSTTVMKEAIELIGGELSVFLPNRFKDGYGPNKEVYQRLIEEGAQLIITVDNGVTGHEAVDFANSQGVDVIITDHHELPTELPNSLAVIHPKHPKGDYPFGELAGVGVAFKVAHALLEEVPVELLDLVAIGTVADLVSLTDENRLLVKEGIKIIQQTDRIGLRALCDVAGLDANTLTAENIGFGLGPRLNAIGRLGEASPGVTLLSTFDEEEALQLAESIQKTNEERQQIVAKISEEALQMVTQLPEQSIYILAKENWHEGVLGIVASQVVQTTGRPAIILNIDKATGLAKGSARSVDQVNLYTLLSQHADLLVKFGGHHMAAGMTVSIDNLKSLGQELNDSLKAQQIDFSMGQPLDVEDYLVVDQMNVKFIEDLVHVGPFGTDNPAPLFLLANGQADYVKAIGANQKHLKFNYATTDGNIDVIAFNYGQASNEIATANELFLVGELTINEWNNQKKPQLMLKDYQIAGRQVFDYREQLQILPELANLKETQFVLFDEKNRDIFKVLPKKNILLYPEVINKQVESVVLLDCPVDALSVREVITKLEAKRVYLLLYTADKCYLNGMPSRELFAQLFKMVQTGQSFDVRYKLDVLANYLKVEQSTIIFMIQVFFELKFVTIENGVMKKAQDLNFSPLDQSRLYQQRLQKIEAEKLLLYSNITEIENWIFQ